MQTEKFFDALVEAIAENGAKRLGPAIAPGEQRVRPALLTVTEAAVYLGRSKQSVQHLIFEGSLKVVRFGRRVHLDRRDLDAWIVAHKE
jgi:excisionase family DNA binding protein